MGKTYTDISPQLQEWLQEQKIFFVATAPLAAEGCLNCSPKGLDTLRVIGKTELVYLDLTGSGVETIAHLQENGRIVLMFCAFTGSPKIVRIHGKGTVHFPNSQNYQSWLPLFPDLPGKRSIIHIQAQRISDSCGYGVPLLTFHDDREVLIDWAAKKGALGLESYRQQKNAASIDKLPGVPPSSSPEQ